MDPIQANSMAAAFTSKASQFGYDVSPEKISRRLQDPGMLIGDAYMVVKEYAVPAATYCLNQVYNWYVGNDELPLTPIEDRTIEPATAEPQMLKAKQEAVVEDEDIFYDAEEGDLDSDYFDCNEGFDPNSKKETGSGSSDEITMSFKKPETPAPQKKAAKKNGPKVGFLTHVPPAFSRKEGMTDAEYTNQLRHKLRSSVDPFKPKNLDKKVRVSSRLADLAKAKTRTEDKHISHFQVEQNFKNSLRNDKGKKPNKPV